MGGLETNCHLKLIYDSGFSGEVRLSRDWTLANRYFIDCEKGWLSWNVGEANKIQVGFANTSFALDACLHSQTSKSSLPNLDAIGLGYQQCFVEQIRNMVSVIQGTGKLLVSGEEGIQSLKLIERCYHDRTLISMPWLSEQESIRANQLGNII